MQTVAEDYLTISWSPEAAGRYHWAWLRDSCACPECRNSHAKQKYFDSAIIPADIKPQDVSHDATGIAITWPDGHQSHYPEGWLQEHAGEPNAAVPVTLAGPGQRWLAWPGLEVVSEGTFPYAEVVGDDTILQQFLARLLRYGFALVSGRGADRTDAAELVGRLAGFPDKSYFGEFFDLEVKPEDQTDSVAFSTRQLPLHTDIPYYITPPDYQYLYGLDVSPEVTAAGTGRTRFVDGLAVARRLREEDPRAFEVLAGTQVRYRAEYPWAEKIYESRTTIIQLSDDGAIVGLVNNPSKMSFDEVPFDVMPDLYRYYGAFKSMLAAEENCSYVHTWHQGDMLVFDNRRIFHGRAEFSPKIRRTLRGGYLREVEILARARYCSAKAA